MTSNSADRAPLSFSEVVLTGTAEPVRAYLTELCKAENRCLTCWFHEDASIDDGEGAVAKAAERLHLRAPDVHVVVTDDVVTLLRERAADATARGVGQILAINPIRSASFALKYRAYAEAHDRELQELLHDLPPSVRLENEQHDVVVDPAAKGIEAYSPAHEYEAHGSATITGRVDLVIAKRTQLCEHELIQAEKIVLEFAQA
jgi:hypothetical protein